MSARIGHHFEESIEELKRNVTTEMTGFAIHDLGIPESLIPK
jgi:hypothetical protein